MSESLYRRGANPSFEKVFSDRYKLLHEMQHVGGRSIQDRNPAYIRITGRCNKCNDKSSMPLPIEESKWNELYKNFKPSPIVENVSITFGGDFGLARKITGNIKCFDLETFQSIQKYFLTPGNYIDVTFGFSTDSQWNPIDDSPHTLKNFRVATFSFTAGEGGTWVGTFTAVSASEAIKTLDMVGGINQSKRLFYIVAGALDGEEKVPVASISELIESDAQRNGAHKLEEITANSSGYIIGNFEDYSPTRESDVIAAMVIYTGDHLNGSDDKSTSWADRIVKWISSSDDSQESKHQIYVTLGYVVDRLVNGQIKGAVDSVMDGSDASFKDLKIRFKNQYSLSTLPRDVNSGNPTSVLILGTDCRYDDPSGYMDFNELKGSDGGASAADVTAWSGGELRLDKILLHRDVIYSAMSEASKEKVNESESTDPKDTKDTVINLNDFFRQIFTTIKTCTGGALALRLVVDPDDQKGETYLVVDQNYAGNKSIPCYVFDPIDGDGSTRECNISSNGGSNEYRTSMFLANSKKGDIAAKMRDCEPELMSIREKKRLMAVFDLYKLRDAPGKVYKDRFNGKQMDALTSVMNDLYRYASENDNKLENINWPGMEIDITINGAYGIIPGCAISTTQLPSSWLNQGIYFMVREVTHNFANSDWTTNIRGIMALYSNLYRVGGKGGGPDESSILLPNGDAPSPPIYRA